MDKKLLDILVCPASRQSLTLLDKAGIELVNRAITAGRIERNDGSQQSDRITAALLTADRKMLYRLDDGIPVLLAEEGIATTQIADFR